MIEILASISGIIAAAAYFPEALKVFKLKEAHEISMITFGIWTVQCVIWLAYGFHIGQTPIILYYALGLTGAASVLLLSLYYDRREKHSSRKQRRGVERTA